MHDGEMAGGIDGLQRSERGMQAEETIEIDNCVLRIGGGRTRNRNRGPHGVVARFTVRNHDIQAISRATLEDSDQDLLSPCRSVGCVECALKPQWSGAHADHGQACISQKNSARRHTITFVENRANRASGRLSRAASAPPGPGVWLRLAGRTALRDLRSE